MRKIVKLLMPVMVLSVLSACTDDFDKINTNDNRTPIADPDYVFGLTPIITMRQFGGNCNWFFFGNYTDQMSVVGGGGPHFGKDGRSDNMWRELYVGVINPLTRIVEDYGDNPAYANRVAIAKTWKAFVYSQMVAMWGPIPFTNACKGEPTMIYDPEELIYRAILKDLKDAYSVLENEENIDKYPAEAEPLLQSNTTRWAQFAHCIRLRVALRLAEVPENLAAGLATEAREILVEELDNVAENKLITQNAKTDENGNFYLNWLEDEANQNPFYKEVLMHTELKDGDPGNFPVFHETLVMWTTPYNDPRIAALTLRRTGRPDVPQVFGRPYIGGPTPRGFSWRESFPPDGKDNPYSGTWKYENFTQVGREYTDKTAKFCFFTYPEILAAQAEATLKGYWTNGKSAEEYYYDLIDAACKRFTNPVTGAQLLTDAAIEAYKQVDGIKWNTRTDTTEGKWINFRDHLGIVDSVLGEDDNFKRIVLQSWINFFYQGIDSWTLLRRTWTYQGRQVMVFKPHFNGNTSTGYITGDYSYTPMRLSYPNDEWSRNTAEIQKAVDNLLFDNILHDPLDQVTFKLIFCKDLHGLLWAPMNGGYWTFPNTAFNYRPTN